MLFIFFLRAIMELIKGCFNMENRSRYGLFTTITMIVGVVVGSGIFFKADNILIATNGSIGLGLLVFCIAAFAIVFGCLTLSNFSAMTDNPGGAFAYFDEFVSQKFAAAFGWFQNFVYYPAITVVIAWVVGIYTGVLFGFSTTFEQQCLIGFAWFLICYVYNLISPKLGGYFQNASTVIKMIPLLLIGLVGFTRGNPALILETTSSQELLKLSWVAAIGPIAFSFDGWIAATMIAHEVKDAKRNLPLAQVIAPLFILSIYVLYFIGVTCLIGPAQVMALGDESVFVAATTLFGDFFAKAIMVFVVISVMGTVNGLTLGYIRLPYSLALRDMLPGSKKLAEVNPKFEMPINSGVYSLIICLLWWIVHYVTMKYNVFPNSDISEIPIVTSYLLYVILYVKAFDFFLKKKIKGFVKGVVCPALATVGSAFILFGGLQNPNFIYFVLICLIIFATGFIYYNKKN